MKMNILRFTLRRPNVVALRGRVLLTILLLLGIPAAATLPAAERPE